MKRKKFLKTLAIACCFQFAFNACSDENNDTTLADEDHQETPAPVKPTPVKRTDNLQISAISDAQKAAICEATSAYSWNLLSEVASQTDMNDNVFLSPLSLAIDLAMLQNGANGATLTEIIDAMGLQGYSSADVNAFFSSVVDEMLKADPKVTLNIANAAYYNTEIVPKLGKDFTEFLTKHYGAFVCGGDFDDEMKDKINSWCNEQTKGTIPSVIDQFDKDEVFELLNAIYLKGYFTTELENNTFKTSFTNANGEKVEQYSIHTDRKMSYYEDNDMQYAELPLGNGSFNVFFVLPSVGKGLDATASVLAKNWNNVMRQLSSYEVEFSVPRFKVEFKSKLIDALRNMGVSDMFSPTKADLMNVLDDEDWNNVGQLYISKVFQKSFFELTHKGVEASAVTVISGSKNCAPNDDIKYMQITRPFIFGIRETTTGAILFNGICNDPTVLELDSKIEEFDFSRPR